MVKLMVHVRRWSTKRVSALGTALSRLKTDTTMELQSQNYSNWLKVETMGPDEPPGSLETEPEHQLGLPSAAPGQYKAREGQDWVVKYLQLVHDTMDRHEENEGKTQPAEILRNI